MRKKTFKIIAITLILFIVVYNFLLSDFNPMFEDEEFVYLGNSIKVAQKENLKPLVDIYNKIHETVEEKRCPCEVSTAYIGPYRHGFSLTKKLYLLKIEKEFTQDDCLKFELLSAEYLTGNIGVKQASKFYFNKSVEQLNEEENIMLIIMLENPSLYNPIRRKEKVLRKVRLYQSILHKKPVANSSL
ncbi:transglycosylase domain-containing protein [Flavobacterium sp. J49]|uniref:transglycosylase domain-containing protein n=1 Tax=Flavobacterium sp. J49 TaxID=2718534 RepID=UPI0015946488|nr:transglycosylase domain-containing protein [Flavobacterium sp. J49]MBF6640231.1 transglycosylase domain-containing protein [Flavobacterium sp. J49]NIC01476.1 hypothetical protein [Flavobacterium sp. J49]